MKNQQFIILFGLPGSGKSHVGKILKDKFGFSLFDGDDCLPQDMKQTLFQHQPISEEMRQRFYQAILTKIPQLIKKTEKLVFMQTFLKDDLRQKILATYPKVKFLMVTCDEKIREERYLKRQSFNLGIDYLRQISQSFELSTIPYIQIHNNIKGGQMIIEQLRSFFAKI